MTARPAVAPEDVAHDGAGGRALDAIPLARTLDRVTPFLGRGLATSAARARVARVGAALPATLSHWLYLESHLASDGDRVDLIVRVGARERARLPAVARDRGDAAARGGDGAQAAAWRSIARLAEAWCTPGTPAHAAVDGVWLEFDLEAGACGAPSGVPAPRVFVDLAPAAYEGGSAAERAARAAAAAAPLFGAARGRGVAAALARALAALPAGATMPYVGATLAGPATGVRACVMGLPPRAWGELLAALGWRGDPAAARRAVDGVLPAAVAAAPALVQVDLPPTGGLGDAVGLEFTFRRGPQVRGALAERDTLDALVAGGACAAAAREALLGWPGCRMEALPHDLWRSLVVRRVNHVKLVVGPDGLCAAKAYLSVSHGFYRPDTRTSRSTG